MIETLKNVSSALPLKEQKICLFFNDSDRVRQFTFKNETISIQDIPSTEAEPNVVRAMSFFNGDNVSTIKVNEEFTEAIVVIRYFGQYSAVYQLGLQGRHTDANAKADIQLSLESIADYLWRTLSRYCLTRRLEVTEIRKKITETLRVAKTVSELLQVSSAYLRRNQIRGFIGEVDNATHRVMVVECFGYTQAVSDFLKRLTFFSEDNGSTNAPIPLSISKRASVSIENILLIKPYLSTYSSEFLSAANTKSLIVIPKFFFDEHKKNERIYILYCDAEEPSYFDFFKSAELDFFFSCFITALVRMRQVESSQSTLTVLSKTVPAHVLAKLQNGENIREEGIGFLFCADIIGSTNLYKELGELRWSNLVEKISLSLKQLASTKEATSYDLVIWDAFFLTLGKEDAIHNVPDIARELYDNVEGILLEEAAKAKVGVRVCITFGDITKDFSNGVNPAWTIVGGAMARICKFENSVKSFGPGIYIDPLCEQRFNEIEIEHHGKALKIETKKNKKSAA